jgi:hypothetical protein
VKIVNTSMIAIYYPLVKVENILNVIMDLNLLEMKKMNDTGFLGVRPEEFIYDRERQLEKKIEKLEEKNKKLEELLQERIDLKELDKKVLLKENEQLRKFIEDQSKIEETEKYILSQLYENMTIVPSNNEYIHTLRVNMMLKEFVITQPVVLYLKSKGVKDDKH